MGWYLEESSYQEVQDYVKEKMNNTPNFKWTSQRGKALEEILAMIDGKFLDLTLRSAKRIKTKMDDLEKREEELKRKEKAFQYNFHDQRKQDILTMAQGLKEVYGDTRTGRLSDTAVTEIQAMVNEQLKLLNDTE